MFVCNGNGLLVKAEIVSSSKKETALIIKETISSQTSNSQKLTIAIAPTKNMDRIEWMVEKCVEIGIRNILPFYSYSIVSDLQNYVLFIFIKGQNNFSTLFRIFDGIRQ